MPMQNASQERYLPAEWKTDMLFFFPGIPWHPPGGDCGRVCSLDLNQEKRHKARGRNERGVLCMKEELEGKDLT